MKLFMCLLIKKKIRIQDINPKLEKKNYKSVSYLRFGLVTGMYPYVIE